MAVKILLLSQNHDFDDDMFFLIQSNEEFENSGIIKNSDFEIDFKEYDLIIGIAMDFPKESILYKSCSEGIFSVKVRLTNR